MKNYPRELLHDSGQPMLLDPSRLMLRLVKTVPQKEIVLRLHGTGFALEDSGHKEGEFRQRYERVNHTGTRYWARTESQAPADDATIGALEKALGAWLDRLEPIYRLAYSKIRAGFLCPFSDVLVIRPGFPRVPRTLDQIAAHYGLVEVPEITRYLDGYYYFRVNDPDKVSALELRDIIRQREADSLREVYFENMPLLSPFAVIPNDPMFAQQWNMLKIKAGGAGQTGWDVSTGSSGVVIAVFDGGCELTHPDLMANYSAPGIDLGDGVSDGSPNYQGTDLEGHGTMVAGTAAAIYNNATGVTGTAGGCKILPIAFNVASDIQLRAGITYAVSNGAKVLNMSFGNGYETHDQVWNTIALNDTALSSAYAAGLVLCAATHNQDTANGITYPATHPNVMAVGASDTTDHRLSTTPGVRGSNYGPQMSVVAPGDDATVPTTFIGGTYVTSFGFTSCATPQVAGLAALLLSAYPGLTNAKVRSIIERTAEKVNSGTYAYADTAGKPSGTWNQEMGYGRINAALALNFADVMIKDWGGDDGTEPSSPPGGDFWDFSDIVIRTFDDNVFNPSDPVQSSRVERHNDNFLYIRVTNNGPSTARNVSVDARITPYVGLQFVYTDWTITDATHIAPTATLNTFATIPAGGSVIAKFGISAAQVESLWGWENNNPWHPCLLASVRSDNDYAFASATLAGNPLVTLRNNLAQRNLTVVNLIAPFIRIIRFPFVVGHRLNRERQMEIVIDRTNLPAQAKLRLSVDEDGRAFPLVDFGPPQEGSRGSRDHDMTFLQRTRIETKLGCCRGVLTLEKGSSFQCIPEPRLGDVRVDDGNVILEGGRRFVELQKPITIVGIDKQPGQIYAMALELTIPASVRHGDKLMINVSQRNMQQQIVGGAGVVYVIGKS